MIGLYIPPTCAPPGASARALPVDSPFSRERAGLNNRRETT